MRASISRVSILILLCAAALGLTWTWRADGFAAILPRVFAALLLALGFIEWVSRLFDQSHRPFEGWWINAHGDRLHLRRVLLHSYLMTFLVQTQGQRTPALEGDECYEPVIEGSHKPKAGVVERRPRARRIWRVGEKSGSAILWGSIFEQVSSLTLQSDGTLAFHVQPAAGPIATVNWMHWDGLSGRFERW